MDKYIILIISGVWEPTKFEYFLLKSFVFLVYLSPIVFIIIPILIILSIRKKKKQ